MTTRDDDSNARDEPGKATSDDETRDPPDSGPQESSDSGPQNSETAEKTPEEGNPLSENQPDRRVSARQTGETTQPPPYRGAPGDGESKEHSEMVLFTRDIAVSILAVVLIGGYIFMISGVWPPMVAIESGSMEPNMNVNDLVLVMDTDRFQPDTAHGETGVVPADDGANSSYEQYGDSGDVIVFNPQGNEEEIPIIHRAIFWVEEDENWYDRADQELIGNANNCDDLVGCPAPHAGFITKGDNNPTYDQTGNGQLDPVKSDWVVGTAEFRVPRVGWLRLQF